MPEIMPEFNALLKYFEAVHGSKDYVQYVNRIDDTNGHQTIEWIFPGGKPANSVADVIAEFNTFYKNNPCKWSNNTLNDYRSGFTRFTEVVLGYFSANVWFERGLSKKRSLFLCQLIADNALFASSSIVKKVCQGKLGARGNKPNIYASWDYMAHARILRDQAGNAIKRGDDCPDDVVYPRICGDNPGLSNNVKADDNTYANQYIKKAVLASFKDRFGGLGTSLYDCFRDYEACHIWDLPDDRRYYASIANLVLLPRSIAGLSDHNNDVKALLKYEAFQRFKFVPEGEQVPKIAPSFYKQIKWRFDKDFFERSTTGPVQSQ